jgi:hypothetical protein
MVEKKNMKDRNLIFILFVVILVSLPSVIYSKAAEIDEIDYENVITITVNPDDSIVFSLQGSHSEKISPWEQKPPLEEVVLFLEVVEIEDSLTSMESELQVKLDPMDYADLANLDLELSGHASDTETNITALIDYPGYLGINGNLGFSIKEPPYGFILDLTLETKLYYSFYPKEQLQQFIGTIPLLETELASSVMTATNGNIVLKNFELLDYTENIDHASFLVKLRLSGDLQEGIQYALESRGELALPDEDVELPDLSMESIDYHVSFFGDSLTLDLETGGTVSGDFNGQLNRLKDRALGEMLESDELNEEERTLLELTSPIDLQIQHLVVESSFIFEEDMVINFYVEGLELRPSSFGALLVFLEELSKKESLLDYKLVFKGGASNNQYIAFNVPENTDEPILLEEQRVVWGMDDIMNLKKVTYEVRDKESNNSTVIISSSIGLVVLGAVGYIARARAFAGAIG